MNQYETMGVVHKSARIDQLYNHYVELEKRINIETISAQTTYCSPVNFKESMQLPRHRWFPYKEGFSPSFVRQFIDEFLCMPSGLVLDPFSGSGTTAIVAGEMNMVGIGYDVSPLTSFIASTKSITMTEEELERFEKQISIFGQSNLQARHKPPNNETVLRYFDPKILDALLKVKSYYVSLTDEKHHNLFKLAFLAAIEPFSTHRKAGNGVKKKTNLSYPFCEKLALDSVVAFILVRLNEYADDIRASESFTVPEFRLKSSLDESELKSLTEISAVLTSPPYANCFDYSKIYMSELWLGDFFSSREDQIQFRENSVRSHVHARWDERHQSFGSAVVENIIRPHVDEQNLWSSRIGSMLSGYFQDMGKLLVAIKPYLGDGAPLGFVVGNSFYGGIAIATDLLLAELAQQHGYEVECVRIYRGVIPSSQQYKLLGENRKYMRESLVVIRNT